MLCFIYENGLQDRPVQRQVYQMHRGKSCFCSFYFCISNKAQQLPQANPYQMFTLMLIPIRTVFFVCRLCDSVLNWYIKSSVRHADYLTTNKYKHRSSAIQCKKEAGSRHIDSSFPSKLSNVCLEMNVRTSDRNPNYFFGRLTDLVAEILHNSRIKAISFSLQYSFSIWPPCTTNLQL